MNEVFGIDLNTWAALNAIGAILGAIGTVAAVVVALRLARRDYFPRLDVRNAIMETMPRDPAEKTLEFVTITGTNLGHTTIKVKGIFCSFGCFRKQVIIPPPFSSDISDQLPKEITHSQQIELCEPLSEFYKRAERHARSSRLVYSVDSSSVHFVLVFTRPMAISVPTPMSESKR